MASVISVTPTSAVENTGYGGLLRFDVSLSEAGTDAITVDYRLLAGTADAQRDIADAKGTVTFAPGERSQTIEVRATRDGIEEPDESVVMEFYDPVGATLSGNSETLKVTNFILDDDGTGNDRALFVSSPVIVEGDGGTRQAVFDVTISEPYGATKLFDWRTENASATAGSDYTANSGQVRFAAGETTRQIRIDVSGDTAVETSEQFRLVVETDSTIADGGIGATGIATILDDDTGAPTITLEGQSVGENIGYGGELVFTVRLSEPSNDAVTVDYRTVPGTAEKDVDYPTTTGTVTFAPGETVKEVRIRVQRDGADEADEALQFELFDATGGVLAGGGHSLRTTAFVLDDDGAGNNLGLSVSSHTVLEGDSGISTVLFEISISRPQTTPVSFDYETQNAGARAGQDYTATSGTVTFAPGQTTAVVPVRVSGDTASEMSEAFNLVVTPTSALADGGLGAVGTALILDDDTGGAQPTLTVEPTKIGENIGYGGNLSFTARLSQTSTEAVTVNYRTLPATATSEVDYTRTLGTLTFAPGETVKEIVFRAARDGADEDDEAFFLEFFDVENAAFEGGKPVLREAGIILDDDGVGLDRALFVTEPVVIEGDSGAQIARFEVTLSRPSTATLNFDYATRNESAVAGQDYAARSGTLTFEPGQTQAVVDVPVNGDTASEVTEFFSLVVTPTSALGDGGRGSVARATIVDNDGEDGLPTLSLRGSDAQENYGYGGMLDWVVTLSEPADDEVTVSYRTIGRSATVDTDFPSTVGELTFAPGETSKTISIRANRDGDDEADESVALELYEPSGAVLAGGAPTLQKAVFILDDDGVGLNRAIVVSNVDVEEPTSGSTGAVFEIRLSRPFETATTINYETVAGTATAGSDFTATSGSITFRPGQTEAAVVVPVLAGVANEEVEAFSLSLSGLPSTLASSGAGVRGEATIYDAQIQVPLMGELRIVGTERDGQTLTLDTSDLSDPNGLGPFSYQWMRDGTDIAGATGSSYTLGQSDIGRRVSAEVSFIDGLGGAEAVTAETGTIDVAPPTSGNDSIVGGALDDRIEGGEGNDTLQGLGGDDGVLGEGGNDVLLGGGGDDNIAGSSGNDSISGGTGNDFIGGGEGNDTLNGDDGNDTLGGGFGDDEIDGGTGDDVAAGGPGDDLLRGGAGDDTMGASFGADTVDGQAGNDSLGGGTGTDRISGGGGSDSIGGGEGDDTVLGQNGSDFLAGGGRNDVVRGGAGNDTINGGDGNDTLEGGAGADVFVWTDAEAGAVDLVLDFEDGVDTFRLSGVQNAPGTGLQGRVDALSITDTDLGGVAGVEMSYLDQTIQVRGVSAADLGVEDFVFL
ncbi:Na-Ca exchanger/integrin-beta4 [Roseivivax marinus]|uniref:Na-Ca exchanger/integrin-beta4 n=1 Tax=Roseivivax marinus TaxID=1379903 RepID=W4HQ17_9RHOB|nr:Calx-beta domain-containing protein [Roseivivax marinus]ETW14211.1 Na-Ca exchanger/integrin-beta4 [Roseivivax marinus]